MVIFAAPLVPDIRELNAPFFGAGGPGFKSRRAHHRIANSLILMLSVLIESIDMIYFSLSAIITIRSDHLNTLYFALFRKFSTMSMY